MSKESKKPRLPTAKERTLPLPNLELGPPIPPPPAIPLEVQREFTDRYVCVGHPDIGRAHLVTVYSMKHHPHPPAQTLCGATMRESWKKTGLARARCQECSARGRKGIIA